MVSDDVYWLRNSIVGPVLAAKVEIRHAVPTDLMVNADVFKNISSALSNIGSPASQGFLKTELDNSLSIFDLGATIAGLQVWKSDKVKFNMIEVWATTDRSMDNRPTMHAGKVQITVA